VRREGGQSRYSVWDNERNKLAVAGDREGADLSFDDAFKTADHLNGQNKQPKEE
jgi:hypothetical protein